MKYHDEIAEISRILNEQDYDCGDCEECKSSYKAVMNIIRKIIKKNGKKPIGFSEKEVKELKKMLRKNKK